MGIKCCAIDEAYNKCSIILPIIIIITANVNIINTFALPSPREIGQQGISLSQFTAEETEDGDPLSR